MQDVRSPPILAIVAQIGLCGAFYLLFVQSCRIKVNMAAFDTNIIISEFRVARMIAAASAERPQVRKVRASQGRMPDNVWWRRL